MMLSIRTALAITFLIASGVPLAVFWFWPHSAALQNKVAEVQERHLLLAKNLGSALELYHRDIRSVFETFAPLIAAGEGDEARNILKNLHFRHVCVADAEIGVIERESLGDVAPCPERIPDDRFEMLRNLAQSGGVGFSGVKTPDGEDPRLFVVTRAGDKLVVGAITTAYFKQLQRRISFGRQGHAALVDQNGRILAHPLPAWEDEARDLTGVSAVRYMMAGKTGVDIFYSPALKGDMIAGYTSVPGPGWGVMIPQPLAELEEVADGINRDVFLVFTIGLILAMTIAWYVATQITARVRRIEAATMRMARGETAVRIEDGRFAVRIRELTNLRNSFNKMSKQLASAREDLINESYKSGHADMAASTLHNLRNAMNPLINRVADAKSILSSAPGEHMKTALEELADPQTDPERRERLLKYCSMSTDEQDKWRAKLDEVLGVTTNQFARIKEILIAEEQFSHEPPVIAYVDLQEVVEEALQMVPIEDRSDILVKVDPSVAEAGNVQASRLLLLQVLQNLLANAMESVSATDVKPKQIIIESRPEAINGRDMVRIVVRDTGVGIESAELDAIFSAGFTRKTDGRGGLGLHWCANTIGRMRGRIFAESEGAGQGARINVLLPRAA